MSCKKRGEKVKSIEVFTVLWLEIVEDLPALGQVVIRFHEAADAAERGRKRKRGSGHFYILQIQGQVPMYRSSPGQSKVKGN